MLELELSTITFIERTGRYILKIRSFLLRHPGQSSKKYYLPLIFFNHSLLYFRRLHDAQNSSYLTENTQCNKCIMSNDEAYRIAYLIVGHI